MRDGTTGSNFATGEDHRYTMNLRIHTFVLGLLALFRGLTVSFILNSDHP